VVIVLRVAVAIMDVVHVVLVGHRDMAAIGSMLMIMTAVGAVATGRAVIGVIVMQAVQVTIVDVVHVALMWHGYVSARGAVFVFRVAVDPRVGGGCHGAALPWSGRRSAVRAVRPQDLPG
jgi:hypothetical protein